MILKLAMKGLGFSCRGVIIMGKDKITKRDTLFIFTMALILIGICIFLNISLFYGFLGSLIITSLILYKRGFSLRELGEMIFEGLRECSTLYLLILLIGATVSVWLSSGVVPTMIYYGLQYMKGMNFLLAAFLITSIMSVFMGTAIGTVSTIGLALLGIGKGFGIPVHVLLGAIISGAFIADKISPISGLLNLTLSTVKIKYRDGLRIMLKTLVPVYILTGVIYYLIGRNYGGNVNVTSLSEYQTAILDGFFVSPLLFLLPILILGLSIIGLKAIITIPIGLVGGILASGILQRLPFSRIIYFIFWGYKGATASDQLNSILVSGGVVSMLEVVLIVAGAISLSSLLEKSGAIQPLMKRTIDSIHSVRQLIAKTGILSGLLTIVTCDQTVGIVLPGRLFQEKYNELGVDHSILARTISDTGTIIAPLLPWNVNALIIGMISGVSALAYGPYAVLCYLCPVITYFFSFKLGVKNNAKLNSPDIG